MFELENDPMYWLSGFPASNLIESIQSPPSPWIPAFGERFALDWMFMSQWIFSSACKWGKQPHRMKVSGEMADSVHIRVVSTKPTNRLNRLSPLRPTKPILTSLIDYPQSPDYPQRGRETASYVSEHQQFIIYRRLMHPNEMYRVIHPVRHLGYLIGVYSVVDLVDLVGRIGPHSRKLVDYKAYSGRNHSSIHTCATFASPWYMKLRTASRSV